ncbi:MAG: HEAT repeat domain-containing protein [Leptolyngbya sp.]|nr:HEAT repeat domain-containing protein [Candidatus Melainabacteria bacterium]
MALTFIQRLVKGFNQAFSRFGEKSTVEIDDFELEHFLIYHGLIGSSPENQRSFRDVRADILGAVKQKSCFEMGVALKIAPLYWEEKLKTIAAEIKNTQQDALLACLVPDNADDMLPPSQNALYSEDWRVRANAATILGFVGSSAAVERLANSLNDTARSTKSAFYYVSNALATFKTNHALEVIEPFLYSDNSWFCVDAAGAMSQWPFEVIAEKLAKGLTSVNKLSDYTAISVSKNYKPKVFLADQRPAVQNGGFAMILALVDPTHKAFQNEQVFPTKLEDCFSPAVELTKSHATALRVTALSNLCDWLNQNHSAMRVFATSTGIEVGDIPAESILTDTKNYLTSDEVKAKIDQLFTSHIWQTEREAAAKDLEGQCLLALIGQYRMTQHLSRVEELAVQENGFYAESGIDALGAIGSEQTVQKLIKETKALVNLESRATRAHSAQPVVEDQPENTDAYWHILIALGHLKYEISFDFLLSAVQDFAPDKRQQALTSLIKVGSAITLSADKKALMQTQLTNSFKDVSVSVKQAAIEAARLLPTPEIIEEVALMTASKETSLWKESTRVLKELAESGHKGVVLKQLEKAAQATRDQTKRERILTFAEKLK